MPSASVSTELGLGRGAGPSLGSPADRSLREHQEQLREAITHQSSSPTPSPVSEGFRRVPHFVSLPFQVRLSAPVWSRFTGNTGDAEKQPSLAGQALPCGSAGTAWVLPGRVHLPTVPLPWALLPGKAWPRVRGKQRGASQPTAARTPRPRRPRSPPVPSSLSYHPPRRPYKLAATGRRRRLGDNVGRRRADPQACAAPATEPHGAGGPARCRVTSVLCFGVRPRSP